MPEMPMVRVSESRSGDGKLWCQGGVCRWPRLPRSGSQGVTIRLGANGQGVAVSYDYGVNNKMGYLWSGCQ